MDYIIYTYGGYAELIASIFNGIARLFVANGEYFNVVGKFSLTIGAVWAGTRAIFNTNIGIFGKQWFFPSFLAFTFLFAPTATVRIHDDGTKEMYSVANVPFAVAFFSSMPSKLSHYLSTAIEDQLQIAEQVKSSHNGVMFGAKLVSKFKEAKIRDPILLDNAKNFSKQCFLRPWIMGNILGKRQEAESTSDIIGFLRANKANNFGIYFKEPNGATSFKTCAQVTEPILTALETEAKSNKILGQLGISLGGNAKDLNALAKRMTETGNHALQSLSKDTENVHQWMKQSMMLNVYRESLDDWREGAGYQRIWPELISKSATRGMYQQALGWLISGEMAAQMLPLLQTIMFLIAAASIFVVFPLAMLPGGFEILKVWLKSLIWVQTWPIFFAIINCIGIAVLASRTGAFGEGYGLDKLSQGSFADTLIYTYAIVQWLAASVPILSWALLSRSGQAFANIVGQMSPFGTANAIGSGVADGNINFDNVSRGNRTIGQQKTGATLDTSSAYNDGVTRVTQSEDGREFLAQNASQLMHNYRGSQMEMNSLNNSYSAQESRLGALTDRSGKLASVEQGQMQDYAQRWLSSSDASDSGNERIANAMRVVASGGMSTTEGFSERDGKATDTNTGLGVNARFGADSSKSIVGGLLKAAGVDLGFDMTAQTGVSARNTHDVGHDRSAQQNQNYNESLDQVRDYAKSRDFKEGVGTSDTLSQGLQDTWREQEQVGQDRTATLQNMDSIQKQLSHINQNQSTVDSNWNDQVLDTVKTQHGLANKQEALSYLSNHHDEGEKVLSGLVGQKYGRDIANIIEDKGNSLQQTVGNKMTTQPDFEHEKERLKAQHNFNKDVTANLKATVPHTHNGITTQVPLQDKVAHDLDQARQRAAGATAEQSAEDFAKTMQQQGVGGKVKVPGDAEAMEKAMAHQKEQFDKVSGSTIVRSGKEMSKNVDDVGWGAIDAGKKGIKQLDKLFFKSPKE